MKTICGGLLALALSSGLMGQQPAPSHPASGQTPAATATASSSINSPANSDSAQSPVSVPTTLRPLGLNVVVLDPAHGGTDQGARGTEGIRESEVVLDFAAATKKALEAQGFQVVMTRDGNENPSFDDRSARANGQRGAVFITLHIASTGLAGTARVYASPDIPATTDATGLIPWDSAQGPFVSLSRKLGDLVQSELAQRFKGSPSTLQTAPVRQLRTTAAPAIAVEISSVSVANRQDLDRMVPGVADAIARGVSAFKPSYVVPAISSPVGETRP